MVKCLLPSLIETRLMPFSNSLDRFSQTRALQFRLSRSAGNRPDLHIEWHGNCRKRLSSEG